MAKNFLVLVAFGVMCVALTQTTYSQTVTLPKEAGATAIQGPSSTTAVVAKPDSFRFETIVDPGWGYELWIWWSKDRWVVVNQNRLASDGKAAFSYLAVGRELKISNQLTLTVVVGPQLEFRINGSSVCKIDRLVSLINVKYQRGGLSVICLNRLSWGLINDAALIDRHVQSVRLPGMPKGLSLRFEWLRTPAQWTEKFVGLQYVFGKHVTVYGYADVASKTARGRLIISW